MPLGASQALALWEVVLVQKLQVPWVQQLGRWSWPWMEFYFLLLRETFERDLPVRVLELIFVEKGQVQIARTLPPLSPGAASSTDYVLPAPRL